MFKRITVGIVAHFSGFTRTPFTLPTYRSGKRLRRALTWFLRRSQLVCSSIDLLTLCVGMLRDVACTGTGMVNLLLFPQLKTSLTLYLRCMQKAVIQKVTIAIYPKKFDYFKPFCWIFFLVFFSQMSWKTRTSSMMTWGTTVFRSTSSRPSYILVPCVFQTRSPPREPRCSLWRWFSPRKLAQDSRWISLKCHHTKNIPVFFTS